MKNSLAALPFFLCFPSSALPEERFLHEFRRLELADVYYSEGASFADFNRDGKMDIVSGPFWYAGPDFQRKTEIYPAKAQDRSRYADNFFSFPYDFDGDAWQDILVVGFPGTPAAWYENPRAEGRQWPRHEVFDSVSNESPHFTDLVGDPRPELVCSRDGRYGYVTVNWAAPREPWKFTAISPDVADKRFGHGLGVGDVDGDGRMDVIVSGGWYRQPESLAGDWKFEAFHFTEAGGAQMFAYDVDGDGDNDIITSLDAHGHGLAWFEQVRDGDQITFQRHLILGERPDENRYGVVFSELHALALADVDGDGLKDIVTGKTYWSHHTRTSSWHDGAVVFWFRLTRQGREVDFVPYQADDDSGIGRQVVVGDVNGDKSPDIVSANMKGTFVLLHQCRPVPLEEWTKAQPAPLVLPPAGAEPVGSLPLGADGGALNLDFEDGTLKDWTSAGEAFAGQPVKGEIDPHRKFAEGKRANPQGQYWIGGFEKALDDKLQGMLTSASFVVTHPYASFRVGGGCQPGIRVELVQKETGKIIFQTHGRDSETMFPEVVDLSEHRGERIFVRLVDEETGGYGHLNFDDFRLHEKRPLFRESVAMPKKASK